MMRRNYWVEGEKVVGNQAKSSAGGSWLVLQLIFPIARSSATTKSCSLDQFQPEFVWLYRGQDRQLRLHFAIAILTCAGI